MKKRSVRAALRAAEAVFITDEVAERLPRAELDADLAAGRPLVILPLADAGRPVASIPPSASAPSSDSNG